MQSAERSAINDEATCITIDANLLLEISVCPVSCIVEKGLRTSGSKSLKEGVNKQWYLDISSPRVLAVFDEEPGKVAEHGVL